MRKLLTGEEIRAIRESYGLSKRGFAALLGLGDITIHRYETGQQPDEAPSQLIGFTRDPLNMRRLLHINGHRLPATARARVEDSITQMLAQNGVELAAQMLETPPPPSTKRRSSRLQVESEDLRHGGRDFSPHTLLEMILFFAAQAASSPPHGVYKTKVNKLLWYADFHHFRRYGQSISGAVYIHDLYGPVAHGYPLYLARLEQEKKLEMCEYQKPEWEVSAEVLLTSIREFPLLSRPAQMSLYAVHRYFLDVGSSKISEISHQEKGYRETVRYQEISYLYAHSLNLDFDAPIA